jgi:3-oxoacyl-[acyl-carrier protein] reductase
MNTMELNHNINKIALVTGASRGIGKAIAEKLVLAGITVIGTATTSNGAEEITYNLNNIKHTKGVTSPHSQVDQKNVLKSSNKHLGLVLDLANFKTIEAVMEQIKELFSELPLILVNNAAVNRDNLFLRMSEEEWETVINTNLTGVFRLTKACIKNMLKARWGRIVNISSIVAFSGNFGQVNYSTTKAGIVGFSKSLAQEVANRGITVNVVAPGFIDTDMTKTLPEKIKEELLAKIPIGRLGNSYDVANAVMFLLSNDASYITGSTIHVNGGMLMN